MRKSIELNKESTSQGFQDSKKDLKTPHAREDSDIGNQELLKRIEASKQIRPDTGVDVELPQIMKERMQMHFGYNLSSVSFKESPEVAEMGAKAYAQGNVIKFAPGQFKPDTLQGRQIIGHELAHIVQQAEVGVKANIEGSPVNYDKDLERMADNEGIKAAAMAEGNISMHSGTNLMPLPPVDAGNAPVQGMFDWVKRLFGGSKNETAKSPEEEPDNVFSNDSRRDSDEDIFRAYENNELVKDIDNDIENEEMTDEDYVNSRNAAKIGKKGAMERGMRLASGMGSGSSAVSYLFNNDGVKNGFGAGAGAAGALSSLTRAYMEAQSITGNRQKTDNSLSALNVASNLGSAATSGASSALNSSRFTGTMLEATAIPIASIGALVTGASDMISGGFGASLAGERSKKLQSLYEKNRDQSGGGIARFASDAQAGKQRVEKGKVVKGALTMGGGLALGAGALGLGALAATPIGWGLLAGAGVFSAGMAIYNKYKRHKAAKAMLGNEEYLTELSRAGIKIPTEEDTAKLPWYKRMFSSQSEMKMELIKGQIADKLAKGEKSGLNQEILLNLGFKDKDKKGKQINPDSREIYRALDY